MKDTMSVEFSGKDMKEVIMKMIDFLNMIKGINLGETEGKHEGQRADRKGT